MSFFKGQLDEISKNPKIWCITGVAGFIGSNILEFLLKHDQKVVGIDNFSTGSSNNLEEVKALVSGDKWDNFIFKEGDITDIDDCMKITRNVDYVLHQAALGSVPRSIKNPLNTNNSNINGFLNMLISARDNNVSRFVYAASSSTYGDHPALPKVEDTIGNPLSPYAVTKYVNELYASVFDKVYGFQTIGLRYFNVFGKRQNPNGEYAAVIPKWISSMINGDDVYINGDGKTSRDFCYIKNVIQANILAAVSKNISRHEVFNVAVGDRTSLNELYEYINKNLHDHNVEYTKTPKYVEFRKGDVRHSQASIEKAKELIGYEPHFNIYSGLKDSIEWYINNLSN